MLVFYFIYCFRAVSKQQVAVKIFSLVTGLIGHFNFSSGLKSSKVSTF